MGYDGKHDAQTSYYPENSAGMSAIFQMSAKIKFGIYFNVILLSKNNFSVEKYYPINETVGYSRTT